MKDFTKLTQVIKRIFVVIALSLLGVAVLAVTYPLIAGVAGGNVAAY